MESWSLPVWKKFIWTTPLEKRTNRRRGTSDCDCLPLAKPFRLGSGSSSSGLLLLSLSVTEVKELRGSDGNSTINGTDFSQSFVIIIVDANEQLSNNDSVEEVDHGMLVAATLLCELLSSDYHTLVA